MPIMLLGLAQQEQQYQTEKDVEIYLVLNMDNPTKIDDVEIYAINQKKIIGSRSTIGKALTEYLRRRGIVFYENEKSND